MSELPTEAFIPDKLKTALCLESDESAGSIFNYKDIFKNGIVWYNGKTICYKYRLFKITINIFLHMYMNIFFYRYTRIDQVALVAVAGLQSNIIMYVITVIQAGRQSVSDCNSLGNSNI